MNSLRWFVLKNLSIERKKNIPEREGLKVKSLDVKKKNAFSLEAPALSRFMLTLEWSEVTLWLVYQGSCWFCWDPISSFSPLAMPWQSPAIVISISPIDKETQ